MFAGLKINIYNTHSDVGGWGGGIGIARGEYLRGGTILHKGLSPHNDCSYLVKYLLLNQQELAI